MKTKIVTLMAGIPGSGKSKYVKENFQAARVVSSDHYFMVRGQYQFKSEGLPEAHAQCLRDFVQVVQAWEPHVVVDNTNTTLVELAPYVALASAYGYQAELCYLLCEPDVAHARNTHGVPLNVVWKLHQQLNHMLSHVPPFWRIKMCRL